MTTLLAVLLIAGLSLIVFLNAFQKSAVRFQEEEQIKKEKKQSKKNRGK